MRNETIYGIALLASVAGLLLTAAFHPTGHDMFASPESLARATTAAVAVHALALVSVGLSLFGLVGLSWRLGLSRPDTTFALVAYVMALAGAICAATLSGFVAPAVGRALFGAVEPEQQATLRMVLSYNGMLNQGFAKFQVVASAIAIAAWSLAAIRTRFDRGLGALGLMIAIATTAALLSGHLRMNVHGLAVVVVAQGAWLAWAGVRLLRSRGGD